MTTFGMEFRLSLQPEGKRFISGTTSNHRGNRPDGFSLAVVTVKFCGCALVSFYPRDFARFMRGQTPVCSWCELPTPMLFVRLFLCKLSFAVIGIPVFVWFLATGGENK